MYPQKVSDNIFFNDWRIFKKQLLQSDFKLRQTENYKGLSIERLGNKLKYSVKDKTKYVVYPNFYLKIVTLSYIFSVIFTSV